MDAYQQRLSAFEDVSVSGFVLATDDYSSAARTLIAAVANKSIFIQKVEIVVSTDHAATQTIQDTASSAKIALKTKASPGLGPMQYGPADFGPDGLQMSEGKGLVLVNSAAGLAYSFSITAYRKLTAVTVGNAAPPAPVN